jgi:hypothetical protein
MAQAASRRPVIKESQIQSQARLCVHINNLISVFVINVVSQQPNGQ